MQLSLGCLVLLFFLRDSTEMNLCRCSAFLVLRLRVAPAVPVKQLIFAPAPHHHKVQLVQPRERQHLPRRPLGDKHGNHPERAQAKVCVPKHVPEPVALKQRHGPEHKAHDPARGERCVERARAAQAHKQKGEGGREAASHRARAGRRAEARASRGAEARAGRAEARAGRAEARAGRAAGGERRGGDGRRPLRL